MAEIVRLTLSSHHWQFSSPDQLPLRSSQQRLGICADPQAMQHWGKEESVRAWVLTKKREAKRSLITIWLAHLVESLQRLPKCHHTLRYITHIILRDSQLDIAKHKPIVQLRTLHEVIYSLSEITHYEMELASVVIYIRIRGIRCNSLVETVESGLWVALLHTYWSDFDKALRQVWYKAQTFFEILFGILDFTHEEPRVY